MTYTIIIQFLWLKMDRGLEEGEGKEEGEGGGGGEVEKGRTLR